MCAIVQHFLKSLCKHVVGMAIRLNYCKPPATKNVKTGEKDVEKMPEKQSDIPLPGTHKIQLLEELLKPEQVNEPNPFLYEKKKRKKHRHRL